MTWVVLVMLSGFFWWGPPWGHGSRWRHRRGANVPDLPEEFQTRLAAVDQLETRVAELESRLDFAERLLAERRTPELSSPPR